MQAYAPYTDIQQANDYVFTITSNILWRMRRVLINIPAAFVLKSPDCMQWEGSTVYVSKCWLDVANNDLWVHILHDATTPYVESSLTLIVRTMNYGVVNPNVAAATSIPYTFPVKMFNWTSTFSVPDGNTVYMTRSSSQNVYFTDSPSVSLTFTST